MIFCALAIVFLGSFLVLGLTALGGDEWYTDELLVVKMWILAVGVLLTGAITIRVWNKLWEFLESNDNVTEQQLK